MSVLDDLLKAHRKRIIEREEATFREMLSVYADLQKDLTLQYKAIQKLMDEARAAGEEITPSWIARSRRLKALIDQVKTEIVRFGGKVTGIVSREQRSAISIAANQTREVINVLSPADAIGSLLPTRTIENAIGMMGDGSPMLAYFEKTFAPAVAEKLRSEIVRAAALGTDFRTIARRLVEAGDITRHRALTMARTEVNRVRRATTLEAYRENQNITGWEWVAAKSERTCVVCLALDGKIFAIKNGFPQHINCRCTMIPVIKGVTRPPRELGREWFERQSDAVKEKILGVDGLAAYKEGLVTLKDFVGWKNSKEFGRSVYTKPLNQILAGKPVADRVIRTPKDVAVDFDYGTEDRLVEMLGRELTHDQIGGLVGALDGAKISVIDHEDGLHFTVRHPLIATQERILDHDWAGRLFIHNEIFRTSRTAPKGTGLKSFATQAFHAERFGIEYIDTMAAGNYSSTAGKVWNGYYSWARMGYNARLTESDWDRFPLTFRGIEDLNGLIEQTNGKRVWLYYGYGRPMMFDLNRDSASFRILRKYLQEKEFEIDFDE